ncbi:glycosyltransferase family 2 protein [Aquihabitans sp. G128]|uniref:glycosyltransferase family 2 protein n=1 Tax=Aquihabitans sp. G128 TaxID=2849779 RepID=UPI001C235C78|nr:glycosyltransferase family 2 protein [Aquihabitans sp. G128]QXC62813.1 glycosyltransferase family 2 protein [Aquihabitans sp. G128]
MVAVLVTHDPGPWFEETLASLAEQTYPDLSLLVVDTGSAVDPTARVHALVPSAHVHLLDHDPGYGAAANVVGELVEGAAFYAFCHDDIALEPDSLRSLVEEAFRSNAGVIGPKLVDWHEPRRLLQVGMGVDKTGVLSPVTERLELDQEQHDAVRDVFVVPGGCTLVRADLFEALGGFDDGIDYLGDDVDLCWRAHVVGARVMIAPAARVRHLEALGERRPVDDRRRRFARHRLRTTLVAYGPFHRARVLPQALLFAVVEALYALVSGHPDHARDVLGAWPWNLRRLGAIRRRRKALKAVRRVSDKEVRGFQVRGSARLSAALRGQFSHRDDRVTTFARSSRDLAGAMRDGSRRLTTAFALLLGVLLLVGSRSLIFDGIPAVGELSRFPASAGTLLQSWWSGWRRTGLGGPGAQPTAHGLLGVVSYLSFGAEGLLRTVLVLGTIPVGALGAWRLARPIGSARASVAAFAVYVALPVPYNALARGSWSGLLLYAASPWLLLGIGRASGVAPFGPGGAEPGERAASTVRRRPVSLILGLGLLLGIVAAFVPFAVVIVAAIGLAFALGSVLCFRAKGVLRMLGITLGACLVAVALQVPWSLDVLGSSSPWDAIVGVGSTGGGPLTLGRILRFESGPWGAPPLGWAFLLAGALPVVIGRSWRLEWAVRAWLVVLAGWALLWAGQEGHLPMGLPAAEVVLAPVAAALAFTAALGLASFEVDLRAYRFGWRQVLSVLAALGVVLGALPLGSGLLDGRWHMPERDYANSLQGLLAIDGRAPFRVLWVGDPEVLPASGWRYGDGVAYATTERGAPTVLDRFAGDAPGSTTLLGRALHQAEDQRTTRLGHLLGPMGVRYLVVPEQLAPGTSGADDVATPDRLTVALGQQIDLERVPVSSGVVVYRNTAWASSRSVLPDRQGDRTSADAAIVDDLRGARPALTTDVGAVDARGEVPVEGDLLVASTADPGWKLRIDGVPMARTDTYGWANQFAATRTGTGRLTYDTPLTRRLAAGGQALLWVLVIVVRRRARNAERRPPALLSTSQGAS